MAESVALARAALADGTQTRGGHRSRPAGLRDRSARAGGPRAGAARVRWPKQRSRSRCSAEESSGHDLVGVLRQPQLEAIAQGPAGSRWVLVEAPFEGLAERLPRRHRRAARTRVRGGDRPSGARRLCRDRGSAGASQGARRGLAGAGERDVPHRRSRRRGAGGGPCVRGAAAGERGGLRCPRGGAAAFTGGGMGGAGGRRNPAATAWSLVRERPCAARLDGVPARRLLAA